MTQQTALSVSALPGPVHSFSAKTAAAVSIWVTPGGIFLFTEAHWTLAVDVYFEVYLKVIEGTLVFVRLWDLTDSSEVAGMFTLSTDLVRKRSESVTLVDNHEYAAQVAVPTGHVGHIREAELIFI